MNEPKYPNIKVKLVGKDGNAFAIIGRVSVALGRAGVSNEERKEFIKEATAGTYDVVLRTAMAWVEVS